jgi:hypothetical protein
VTQYDPQNDPYRPDPARPVVTETVETVVVRESSTGWWIAGILGGLVMIGIVWFLLSRGAAPESDAAILEAEAKAAAAQAQADQAAITSQVAGAQASVDIARADAARSQADAARAASEARAAEARAVAPSPIVIEREVQPPPTPAPGAVTSPDPAN